MSDTLLHYEETDCGIECRTFNIKEELGQVWFIFYNFFLILMINF